MRLCQAGTAKAPQHMVTIAAVRSAQGAKCPISFLPSRYGIRMMGSHESAWKNTIQLMSLVRDPIDWVTPAERTCKMEATSIGTEARSATCEDDAPSAIQGMR